MNKTDRKKGAILATAAAALFVTAPMVATAGGHKSSAEKTGHCVGANSCKGTSACATATTSCKGQNSCKGQGFTVETKADCEAKGGKFEDA